MIFIGKDHNNTVISIVSAKQKESANAYWQGKGIMPHSIEEFDLSEDRENEEMGYVTPILNTKKETFYHNGRNIEIIAVVK